MVCWVDEEIWSEAKSTSAEWKGSVISEQINTFSRSMSAHSKKCSSLEMYLTLYKSSGDGLLRAQFQIKNTMQSKIYSLKAVLLLLVLFFQPSDFLWPGFDVSTLKCQAAPHTHREWINGCNILSFTETWLMLYKRQEQVQRWRAGADWLFS